MAVGAGSLALATGAATIGLGFGLVIAPDAALAAATTGTSGTVATSTATAFQASLPGAAITSGASQASAGEAGWVSASGAGLLAPQKMGVASASAQPGSGSQSVPQTCSGPALPHPPAPFSSLLTVSGACGQASASAPSSTDGTSSATGTSVQLSLDLAPLLSEVVQKASPVATALQKVLGKLPPLPAGGETVSKLLGNVVTELRTNQLLTAAIGRATSTSGVATTGWTTTSMASGSVITLLPGAGGGGAPLVKILVGGSSATAGVSRPPTAGGSDRPTASDTPSLVTVVVDAPAVGPKTYSIVPGQSFTVLQGTPLQSTISVGSGQVASSPSGTETASASAVTLDLAQGAGATGGSDDGGLKIVLAQATAAAALMSASTPKTTPPPLPQTPVPGATTPHTGLPWAGAGPLIGGAGAVGAALLWRPRKLRQRRLRRSGGRHHGVGDP